MATIIKTLLKFDSEERRLESQFLRHPFFNEKRPTSDRVFKAALLQKVFHAFEFSPLIDWCINLIAEPSAKKAARQIIREEYPEWTKDEPADHGQANYDRPSHREDLLFDLKRIGIADDEYFSILPTEATTLSLASAWQLIRFGEMPVHRDILGLVFMRFWGEVLVAHEYRGFRPRLEKMGLKWTTDDSHFYCEHCLHDEKTRGLGDQSHKTKSTHADRLGKALAPLLDTPEKLTYAFEIEQRIVAIKEGFYDQFTK
jgi:hypothetical protein